MFGLEKIFGKKKEAEARTPNPEAAWHENYGGYNHVISISYDGEKNTGELGPIFNYLPDYNLLRFRSWQAYLESDIGQIIISRYAIWVIGAGLKLQCEPQRKVLESEGIVFDPKEFISLAESRYSVYAESAMSSYSGMGNLHELAGEALINAIVGGDVLVVHRYVDKEIKVELIDGAHVDTPLRSRYQHGYGYVAENGNRIVNGVELSATGEHVAFYVKKADSLTDYERIPAKGEKTGMVMAHLMYGLRYRLNSVRGLPLIVAVMETMKKLERYKEATVGSAEERQKIPYFFEHDIASTGENPQLDKLAQAINPNRPGQIPVTADAKALADKVAATMNKQVYNMPNGATIKALDSDNELTFGDFYMSNFDLVCATVNIPPNVALGKYDTAYSASRASGKDWEHTMQVKRIKQLDRQFYSKNYTLWLHAQVLKNKIQVPGYLDAFMEGNEYALCAFRKARYVGDNMPHIDPVKEVTAVRMKLGPLGANLPLTTLEAATEELNGGESIANMEQFGDELEQAEGFGIPLGVITEEEEESAEEEEEN